MKYMTSNAIVRSLTILSTSLLCNVFGLSNGLVKTPPMGWNSWNVFHENINENQIKEIADIMVTSGMKDAGYIYLNLDDNWMATSRDASGNLRADPTRFPSGMKALGDYIHNKGLKFGIYGDRGNRTCYHYNANIANTKSGSHGTEERDAKTFASWGVDYLKYDNCDPASGSNQQKDYENMRDALAKSGRDIVYSICAWGYQSWMPATGNLWRTTGDISNSWETATNGFFKGVINIVDLNEQYAPNASPTGWNDPDMLQIGNGVLSADESRSHMSMWAIMAAPLIAGNNIKTMTQTTKDILMNKEVIAVNQDSLGSQGRRISAANNLEIWSKQLGSKTSSTKAVALLNRSTSTASITVKFADIGLTGEVLVRDLWGKADKGKFTTSYTASVPAHGTVLLKVSIAEVVTVPQAAYADIFAIPGTIEAENYDVGGEGVSYHDADYVNSGNMYRTDGVDITGDLTLGYKVGWTVADEWLEYSVNVTSAGTYTWTAKVSMGGDSAAFHMTLDSVDITGRIQVVGTGTWDDYKEVTGATTIPLTAGKHVLRVTFDRPYMNLDCIAFTSGAPTRIAPLANIAKRNTAYKLYSLQGQMIGTVNGSNDQELRNSIWKAQQKPGLYIIKSLVRSQMISRTICVGFSN